ncbi:MULTISPECIES: ABC transporter permease [unclassified Crossiella]|uniref:ABC transporter permease n=1 Tax=unclassified Crossiella TaxID=2620835 RepID=UPI001FFF53A8|nr:MULTISPECIES: ABC transporter permease [unclassified Crossiella]MCK2242674.1 ABC transporter permease [Crossiella sp. S99.2]MCK2256551.1 ABC transporter permease [Crossiella sp. S99.1]
MITFPRVVRSEWTKLLSTRSAWLVLLGLPLALTLLAGTIGWQQRHRPATLTEAIGGGFLLYALTFGIFGVLTMAGEHSSGLIRTTLLAVPRRLPVLWAKAVVLVAATLPALLAGYLGAFLAHQAFATRPLSLGDPGVLLAILGAAEATVLCAVFGLAVGTLIRGLAGAIGVFVLGLVVLPQALLGALPADLQDTVLPYLPTFALQAMFATGTGPLLSPGWGTAVGLGWAILLLGGAAAMLRRREL